MAHQQEDNSKENKVEPKKDGFLGRFHPLELVVYAGVLVSTLVTSYLSIGNRFAINLQKNGLFKDLLDAKRKAYQDLDKTGIDFIKETAKIEKTYADGLKAGLKEIGIKNSFDKLRALKAHNQLQVAFNIVGVIVIGGLAAFFIKKERESQKVEKELIANKPKHEEVEYELPEKLEKVALGEKTKAVVAGKESSTRDTLSK